MPWKGPLEDGVTQSLLKKYMNCPYSFYLYAILGLKEDKPTPLNLMWGDCFHVGLEHMLEGGYQAGKEAMLTYLTKNYPTAPPTFQYTLPKMLNLYKFSSDTWRTEKEFDEVYPVNGRPTRFRGKRDGIKTDYLLEHKCKGYVDLIQTKREIKEDMQCNLYMWITDVEWVQYDLIRIPEAQKYCPTPNYKDSPEEYVHKLFHGPCGNYTRYPIHSYRHEWIHQAEYFIPREDQELYWNRTLLPQVERLWKFWDHVNSPDFDPDVFNDVYYRMPVRHFDGAKTEKFECEYYAFKLGEEDFSDLIPVDDYFAELSE